MRQEDERARSAPAQSPRWGRTRRQHVTVASGSSALHDLILWLHGDSVWRARPLHFAQPTKRETRVEYQTLSGACCSCRIHSGATGTGGTATSGLATLVLACVYGGKWLLPQCDAGAEEGQTSAHVARTRCLSHSFSPFPCSRASQGHCMTHGEEAVEHSTKGKRH